jgi:hypothetical protein
MALVYLVNKPQVLGKLLLLEYEFTIVYKLNKTHVVVDVLFRLPNSSEPLGVLDKIVDALLFYVDTIWMQEVKTYLKIG